MTYSSCFSHIPPYFTPDSTTNACTKGLWIWGEPVTLEDGITVLFIDSEGLGSTNRTNTVDMQIFSLAVLLSSSFIWNSRGVIDGNAIDDFGLVVELSKSIQVSARGEADGGGDLHSLSEHFPAFTWVVRDFTLRLERNGRPMAEAEYLEEALKSNSAGKDSRDEIRKLLKTFFKRRDCVTLVRPAEDEGILRTLSAQPLSSLRPDFVRSLLLLKDKMYSGAKPKMMHGRPVSGTMLATLAESYATALNSGGVPTISTAWDRVIATQASASAQRALEVYRQHMASIVGLGADQLRPLCTASRGPLPRCHLPLDIHELDTAHAAAKVGALTAFAQGGWTESINATTTLCALITDERSMIASLNLRSSYEFCVAVADRLVAANAAHRLAEGDRGMLGFADRTAELLACYSADARGPAKDAVMAQVLCANLAVIPSHEAAKAVAAGRLMTKDLKVAATRAVETADGLAAKVSAETEAGATELGTREREISEARAHGEAGVAVESARLEAKKSELARAGEDLGRLDKAFDFALEALTGMLAEDEKLLGDLHETYMKLQDQSTGHDLALALPPASKADTAHGADLLALVAVERTEVDLLLTHTSQVQQNISATKELNDVKEAEVSEREFQWGMAKASVAHEEGEAMTVDEEISVLRTLAAKLKAHISSTTQLGGLPGRLSLHGSATGTPVDFVRELDAKEQEVLRNLEAPKPLD